MTNEEFQKVVLEQFALFNQRFDQIDQRFDQNERMIVELTRIVTNTNAIVEEIRSDMVGMKEDISDVRRRQDKQEKVIESISIHLLEQEADIRELRRAR